jgi:hypothetical protein
METWVGAARQLGPSATQQQYLYTGLAPVSTIALLTAPRWLIVLIASTGALSLALAGIYLPVLRRRWVLGLVACVVAVTAVVFPVPALLLAQASLLGVVLAVLAIGSTHLLVRPSPWRVVMPASGSPRHAGGRSDSAVVTPVLAAGSTAPTVSLRVPASE